MGTAYLDVCITPRERGVTLFQAECIAEVEYVVTDGEIDGWHVSNLKFQEYGGEWGDTAGTWSRKVSRETWCPKDLLKPLIERIDQTVLEETLFDLLRNTGEIGNRNTAAERADYHARVL